MNKAGALAHKVEDVPVPCAELQRRLHGNVILAVNNVAHELGALDHPPTVRLGLVLPRELPLLVFRDPVVERSVEILRGRHSHNCILT